ncbi:MAG: DUF1579 family protein [Calditrichia bacterium]
MTSFRIFAILLASFTILFAQSRDGKLFDPAVSMTERSSGAPEQIELLLPWIGNWSVELKTMPNDTTTITRTGAATFTLMNRGHAFMERFHCADFNGKGNELNTASMIVFNPSQQKWGLGIVNSYTESVSLYDGKMDGKKLIFRTAVRGIGGLTLTYYLAEIDLSQKDKMYMSLKVSRDHQQSWQTVTERRYSRSKTAAAELTTRSDYGQPAPDLPEEAREFDFLLGEATANHDITLPNGQQAKFPVNATAVHTMNGHAIMEFNWFDVDPSLPDAATTIIRIYNRTMRRWENLFANNRGNGLLFFGGVKEGNDLVLTLFDTNNSNAPFSYFVFHSIEEKTYKWYAKTSWDRGKTFRKTWLIDVLKK